MQALPSDFRAPGFEGFTHRVAHRLQRKVDDRRRPADRGRPRPPLIIVRAHRAAKGHIQMRVHIDAPGKHEHPGCIDDPVPIRRDPRRNLRNRLALNQHIGERCRRRTYHLAAFNQNSHTNSIYIFSFIQFSRSFFT